MFSTLKQRLLLGAYIFIVLSIPVGSYLVSQSQIIKSSAQETKKLPAVKTTPPPTTSPARELLDSSSLRGADLEANPSPSVSPTTTVATSFGPTLSLKATLEGRPKENQATRLFVGIAEGAIVQNPKFLLNFTVDLPPSGEYSGLSLAGLSSGSSYTALLKGAAQIASTATFVMSPTVTNLGNGEPLNLLSGDLNEDNMINSSDYSIAQKALGSNPTSANWNENADFNKDALVNTFDLAIITKNMGQIGASGAWTSPLPQVATPSGGLTPEDSSQGQWIWVPEI